MHKQRPRRLHAHLVKGLSHTNDVTLDYPILPVPVTGVRVEGGFWGPRIETHRNALLPHAWEKLHHNIENLDKAAGRLDGLHQGLHWDDSDLFKVMEGAAYALLHTHDPELEAYLEDLIERTAAAQEPDGYLYTARTIDPQNPAPGAGPTRWSFLPGSHELYCMGHMIEAAVAHHEATGRRAFLNIALLVANMVDATFGEGKLRDVDGHQEIEIALARLYRVTGDPRFLRLCRWFLDERGRHDLRKSYGEPEQDHLPVLEQKIPVGHAVRAVYMYAAMADVAAMMDDQPYAKATEHLWEEVVTKRIALTGAVGPRHDGEAFGEPYELPNDDPHNETCATVGMILWSHRLFLLTGDVKYLDVLERALYNGYLASHALDGRGFFYCNPLEATPTEKRNVNRPEWQGCACCPTNVARLTPSVGGLVYATLDNTLYVGLYLQGEATIPWGDRTLHIVQETDYPHDGAVTLTLKADGEYPTWFDLALRVPGWARETPIPGGLYRYEGEGSEPITLERDGRPLSFRVENGFLKFSHSWRAGEAYTFTLRLPMPVRRVVPHEKIEATAGKVALERGPLVYCVEGVDHGGSVAGLSLPDGGEIAAEFREDLLGGVVVLRGTALEGQGDDATTVNFTAIPYYAWNNRGSSDMKVWIPRAGRGDS